MMMPSRRNSFWNDMMNPFDDFMNFTSSIFDEEEFAMPKMDIKDLGASYEMDIELPGVKKEDVTAKLEEGYLTIQARQNHSEEEKDSQGRFIRRERYQGSYSRSFFVGKNVRQEDISATFEHGILKLNIPKDQIEEQNSGYIRIEG